MQMNDLASEVVNQDDIPMATADTLTLMGNEGKNCMEPHTCCICLNVFSRRGVLKIHLERKHLRINEMFCDLCPRSFFAKNDVHKHMKIFHLRRKKKLAYSRKKLKDHSEKQITEAHLRQESCEVSIKNESIEGTDNRYALILLK